MNVKDFEYVVEIAKHGSITKAANQLYLTQPTLSKFLQRLEKELKTPLFHRMGKNLVPTPAGECFIEKAFSIMKIHDQLTFEIQNIVTHQSGTINLGLPSSRSSYFIATIVPEFQKIYPFVKLSVERNSTEILVNRLKQGEFDMLLVNYQQASPSLQYWNFDEDRMVLAVPGNSPLVEKAKWREGYHYPFLETDYWKDSRFILTDESSHSGWYARQLFSQLGIEPLITLQVQSIDQAILAVHHGIGNTILPSSPLGYSSAHVSYLSIDNDNKPIKVAMVTRRGKYLSDAELKLMEIIEQKHKLHKSKAAHVR